MKIKNWGELKIGDTIYLFKTDEAELNMKFLQHCISNDVEVSLGKVDTDTVVDRYDKYKIELENHGLMEFCDYDLDRNSDVAYNENKDSIMFMATSEKGLLNEIKKFKI
jgi:hypothetical protein